MEERRCAHPASVHDLCVLCGADLSGQVEEGAITKNTAHATTLKIPLPRHTARFPVGRLTQRGRCAHSNDTGSRSSPGFKKEEEEASNFANTERQATADEDARRVAAARLVGSGKLVLALDLDQTLVHATSLKAFPPCTVHTLLTRPDERPHGTEILFVKDEYGIVRDVALAVLRPHLAWFLQSLQVLYDIHLCTMGAREYAAAARDVIDPSHTLISSVVSRAEFPVRDQKTLDVLPVDARVCVIVDDCPHVWRADHQDSVVQVSPFVVTNPLAWSSSNVNDAAAPSSSDDAPPSDDTMTTHSKTKSGVKGSFIDALLAATSSITTNTWSASEKDDELVLIERVARRIHASYFSEHKRRFQTELKSGLAIPANALVDVQTVIREGATSSGSSSTSSEEQGNDDEGKECESSDFHDLFEVSTPHKC